MTRRRWFVRVLLALVVASMLGTLGSSMASATFRKTTTASSSAASATLLPPTMVRVRADCSTNTVTLTWNATSSTYAAGYHVQYTRDGIAGDGPSVNGRFTRTVTFSISKVSTYAFTVVSTSPSAWTSVEANANKTVKC